MKRTVRTNFPVVILADHGSDDWYVIPAKAADESTGVPSGLLGILIAGNMCSVQALASGLKNERTRSGLPIAATFSHVE